MATMGLSCPGSGEIVERLVGVPGGFRPFSDGRSVFLGVVDRDGVGDS